MEEFKAKYHGRKGTLELGEKELAFVPKHEAEGRVTIKYADMTGVNQKGFFGWLFTIVLIPFVILFFFLCLFSRQSAGIGGGGKVKVKTSSSGSYTFYVKRGSGSVIRQLKSKLHSR
jgi:hypothetical protein